MLEPVKSRKKALKPKKSVNQRKKCEKAPSFSEMASYLQEKIGQNILAYLSGKHHPKTVNKWINKGANPSSVVKSRIREAYIATEIIMDAYDKEAVRMWFFGTNALLNGEAPAYVLCHGENPDDWRLVVIAAKEFVSV